MNRRTFLSALAGLPVIGKYWKPKEPPLSPESLTDAPLPIKHWHVAYNYNSQTGKLTDSAGNEVQTTFTVTILG